MSHFPVVVLTKGGDPRGEAERLLAPYDEKDEMFRDGSRWDWWTIGGRWTGSLTGYRPEDDPDNYEVCDLCHGTGTRPGSRAQFGDDWAEWCNGCNGCQGKGTRMKFSHHWQPHEGDVLAVTAMRTEFVPLACVTPDGEWHEAARMGWFGAEIEREKSDDEWGREYAQLLFAHRDAVAVLVDCHV